MSRASHILQLLTEAQRRSDGDVEKARRVLLENGIEMAADLPDEAILDLLEYTQQNGQPDDDFVRLMS